MQVLLNLLLRLVGFFMLAVSAYANTKGDMMDSISLGILGIGLLVGSQRWK